MARNLLKWAGTAVALLLAVLSAHLLQKHLGHKLAWTAIVVPFAGPQQNASFASPGRKTYPFSVIPGGAYSPEELRRSRRIDPVVARHYAGFGDAVSVQRTSHESYMYVSYRKDNRVYWSRTKHRIPHGEYLLTDGKNVARARCGNRLSAAPQQPVADADEPAEERLNQPEPPGDTYLADLQPPDVDPAFSVLPAANQPMLDVSSSAPKLTESAMQGSSGSPFGPSFWTRGPGMLSPGSKQPGGSGSNSSVPPILPVVPQLGVSTPEPGALELILIGGAGALLGFLFRPRSSERM